ncbi:acyl carrier protein, partial [Saccharopolyspora shandongensis]|uniref:acyl carrier protein n=1 Tax=Saccharopolyspora shandongensis TaxID=418495 RepID=UPI0033E4B2F5
MEFESVPAPRLTDPSDREQFTFLLELVRQQVAEILGYTDLEDVAIGAPFVDLGLDSLTALDLRDRLAADCALDLPSTAAFDYPTPAQLAEFLHFQMPGRSKVVDDPTPVPAVEHASAADEPIAIVGMACRLPGGIET